MTARQLNDIVHTALFYLDPSCKIHDWKNYLMEVVRVMPIEVLKISAARTIMEDDPNGTWDEMWVEACAKELENRFETASLDPIK